MDNNELRQLKERCLRELREYVPYVARELEGIDKRILDYVEDAIREDIDTANIYELLGIRKVFRLMRTYKWNIERFSRWLTAIEGVWQDGMHVRGGLKFDTPRGMRHVQLMPYQVWCLAGIYLLDHDVDMEREYNEGDALLPTEFVLDGEVYDTRRLCVEAHLFLTRKNGKTSFGGAIDQTEANVLGDSNAQVLLCANSSDQSKIAFKEIKKFCHQLDPSSTNRGNGKYLRVTERGVSWQQGWGRTSEIIPMSAGGKKKDGLYASLVHADEHGSATYVKGHSDMQDLVEVCWGSTGPRREPLLLHTTTAGLCNEGPYQLQLRGVEEELLKEMDYELGKAARTDNDQWFALLLRLDPWEITDDMDKLNKEHLFRKVNRSIGITVQPDYYRRRIKDAKLKGEDTRKEVLTKDFNIWQTDKKEDWIKPEKIRELQVPLRIDDCVNDDGWQVFVGQDFSLGDDLHAQSYEAWRMNPETGEEEFFADLDAWITEHALKESPLQHLFEKWAEQGWLHVVKGETLEPSVPIDRLVELYDTGVHFMAFGHDPYKAKTPINALKAWIYSEGGDPKNIVVPVRQNFATYNPLVDEMDYMIKAEKPMIHFSMNPMWPWEFGNCVLMYSNNDGYDNKKPVKRTEDGKVDNVQALLSAHYLFDLWDGKENREE